MIKLTAIVIASALSLTPLHSVAAYNSNMSNSSNMNNVQVNNSGSSHTVVDGIYCPTASMTVGAATMDSESEYYDSSTKSMAVTVGIHIPIDLGNGTLSRCRRAQEAAVYQRKLNDDWSTIRKCIDLHKAGIKLDPRIYPWAKRCDGLDYSNFKR